MNFSSISAYLDPANWQQQMSHQVGGSSSGVSSQLLPPPSHPPPPPPPPPASHGVGGTGLIRPGSMAERARMANMPMPETALKCPRCESTNTKFCYFNNYSLTQPRHFCKTCRRYWTRGGALRSVPVGGGCRRNKRSKGSSSKSPVSSDRQTSGGSAGNSSTSTMPSNSGHSSDMIGLSPHIPPLRFMAPLHQQLSHDYEIGGMNYALSYGALSAPMSGVGNDLNFQVGNANLGGGNGGGVGGSTIGSLLGLDQWRLQQAPQFPFLSGLDSSSAMFDNATGGEATGYMGQARQKPSTSRNITQLGNSMKMEDNQGLNVGRQFLSGSIQGNHEQYWSSSANAWSDLSGFSSSSSTRNPL